MICVQIKVAGSDVSLFANKGFFDWKRKTLIADVELELQCVIADLVKIMFCRFQLQLQCVIADLVKIRGS